MRCEAASQTSSLNRCQVAMLYNGEPAESRLRSLRSKTHDHRGCYESPSDATQPAWLCCAPRILRLRASAPDPRTDEHAHDSGLFSQSPNIA